MMVGVGGRRGRGRGKVGRGREMVGEGAEGRRLERERVEGGEMVGEEGGGEGLKREREGRSKDEGRRREPVHMQFSEFYKKLRSPLE